MLSSARAEENECLSPPGEDIHAFIWVLRDLLSLRRRDNKLPLIEGHTQDLVDASFYSCVALIERYSTRAIGPS
jgi:hypothetical protein